MTFVVVLICASALLVGIRILARKALRDDAKTQPLGTVKTYTYTGKSGGLFEQVSKLRMEDHLNMMLGDGWDVVNQTGLPGHVRLGRTLAAGALTGGLSLLAGGSRTADRVTITYRRVQIPAQNEPAPTVKPSQQSMAMRAGRGTPRCPNCGKPVGTRPRCGFCGTENPATASVPALCPACKFVNAPGSRFCVGCGTNMQRRRALKVIGLCVLIFVGTPVIGAFVQQWIEDSQTTTTSQSSQRKPDLAASDIDYATYCQSFPFDEKCPGHEKYKARESDGPQKAAVPEGLNPAEQKAALKALREQWAKKMQEDIWRQGVEMTFQAQGSTLYVKYVLAGNAFRFQFQEQVVQPNMSMLKQLGFTQVLLDNGDDVWSWRVD